MEDKELERQILETKEEMKGHIDVCKTAILVTDERVISMASPVDMLSSLTALVIQYKNHNIPVSVIRHAVELGLADGAQKYMKDTMESLIEEEKKKIKEMEEFLK